MEALSRRAGDFTGCFVFRTKTGVGNFYTRNREGEDSGIEERDSRRPSYQKSLPRGKFIPGKKTKKGEKKRIEKWEERERHGSHRNDSTPLDGVRNLTHLLEKNLARNLIDGLIVHASSGRRKYM